VVGFARPKLELVRRSLGPGVRTLLEVGAGSGFLSLPLSEVYDLTCLDFSENMLSKNPLPADRKVVGRAEDLPFSDDSFDAVLCANLLHHLEEPQLAVVEMRRVARRHLILIEPNARNPLMFLFGLLKKSERGTLKFSRDYLAELGRAAGLLLRAESVQGFIVPNRTPTRLVPWIARIDREHPLGFYCIAVFDK
jgi:ubiquinone/menaquinone biosynthesis C-methylase UbiE